MRRIARLFALLACALVLGSAQAILLCVVRGEHRVLAWLPMRFHCAVVRLLGLHVSIDGTPADAPRTAWVANHLSYLDVPVLGACLPARFVAKDEVRQWPVFGLLSHLQRTVFIGRRRADTNAALDSMAGALGAGGSLVLFAEGTTSDGRDVQAFRPPAFAVLAAVAGVAVQPVTITVNGPDAAARRDYAYIDDDRIATHLWRFLGRARTDVHVVLHPPMPAAALGEDRKAAAACVRAIVASALPVADPA